MEIYQPALSVKVLIHHKHTLLRVIMADIINLNKKRKAKNRLEKEKKASENRIKFGRTKQEKQLEKQNIERNNRNLDGHKLEDTEDE